MIEDHPDLIWHMYCYKVYTSEEPVLSFDPRFLEVEPFLSNGEHALAQIYPRPVVARRPAAERRRTSRVFRDAWRNDGGDRGQLALMDAFQANAIDVDDEVPADEQLSVSVPDGDADEAQDMDWAACVGRLVALQRRRGVARPPSAPAAPVVADARDDADHAAGSVPASPRSSACPSHAESPSSSSSRSSSSSSSSGGEGDDDTIAHAPSGTPRQRSAPQPRNKGIVVPVDDAGSTITLYRNSSFVVAHCRLEHHGRMCRLTRTCVPSDAPRREGQGRPLGLMAAWLAKGSDFPDSASRVRWCNPALAERRQARRALAEMPATAALFEAERGRRESEHSEPDDVP